MADIFGKEPLKLKTPVTADKCRITMDGKPVAEAMQFSLEYSQSITRRRSIGNNSAVIYGSQPMGRASMARLITVPDESSKGDSWNACIRGRLTFELGGGCDSNQQTGKTYTAEGCIVSAFSVSASADDLTVVDNVVIEFMELIEK